MQATEVRAETITQTTMSGLHEEDWYNVNDRRYIGKGNLWQELFKIQKTQPV